MKSATTFPESLPGIIDSHAHTWDKELHNDHSAVLERSWSAGLSAIIEVGVDLKTSRQAAELADQDPRIHAVAGLHPHEAKHLDTQKAELEQLVADGDFVAVGEIGLDFFRNFSSTEEQERAFSWQLELALEHSLPVVIHSREADDATYEILKAWASQVGRYLPRTKQGDERPIGMLHCFSGDSALAQRYLELGFLISIPGTVTYPSKGTNKNRGQDVAQSIPLTGMLLETDCPYLTPVPHRGYRNEPALVVETARFVAQLRGEQPEIVANVTADNARVLFDITTT